MMSVQHGLWQTPVTERQLLKPNTASQRHVTGE